MLDRRKGDHDTSRKAADSISRSVHEIRIQVFRILVFMHYIRPQGFDGLIDEEIHDLCTLLFDVDEKRAESSNRKRRTEMANDPKYQVQIAPDHWVHRVIWSGARKNSRKSNTCKKWIINPEYRAELERIGYVDKESIEKFRKMVQDAIKGKNG